MLRITTGSEAWKPQAPLAEEMDFVLDRPFLFAITESDGLPLFVGAVNRPAD